MSARPDRRGLEVENLGDATVVCFTDRKILVEQRIQTIGEQLQNLVSESGGKKLLLNFRNVEYFLLTGTPIFAGKTIMEICIKHVRAMPGPPSVRLGRPVSPDLEALILRCLAKNPKDRPSGARILAEALDQLEPSECWTRMDANAWWTSFKTLQGADTASASTPVAVGTQMVASLAANEMTPLG
jgi:serine/threonine protein kinase